MNIQAIHLAGLSPLKQDDKKEKEVKSYKLMPFDKLIIRQQFNESRFKSDAVSPAGAISIAQITRKTFNDGLEKGYVPKGTKYEDLAKDDNLAEQFQRAYMEDLMGRDWNTLGTKSESELVQQVKALAAYNMGPTRLVNILNEMKADGIDIYSDDLVWVEKLPEYHKDTDSNDPIYESMHYVQNIMLGGDEVYERDYERLYNERFPDQIEEEVEEKEDNLGTRIRKAGEDILKEQKKTNWWEKWLSNDDSSLKSTNVNPLMGLSPFKEES